MRGTEPVICLRIRLLRWREFPPTPDNDYVAEIIQDGGNFCYRARGVTVPITLDEYESVIANPFMYYFSTALKLHLRIDKAREGQVSDGGLSDRNA